MDATTVRRHLAEVTMQLARNEEEHEVLISLQKGYEGWLRLNPDRTGAPQPLQLPLGRRAPRFAQKGTVSLRGAILGVLMDARGEPLHVREILTRATARGAATTAKNPLGAVDLTALSLSQRHPIKRVAPRTWRYAKQSDEDGTPM